MWRQLKVYLLTVNQIWPNNTYIIPMTQISEFLALNNMSFSPCAHPWRPVSSPSSPPCSPACRGAGWRHEAGPSRWSATCAPPAWRSCLWQEGRPEGYPSYWTHGSALAEDRRKRTKVVIQVLILVNLKGGWIKLISREQRYWLSCVGLSTTFNSFTFLVWWRFLQFLK